jgi:chemotaxis response regulator CheB
MVNKIRIVSVLNSPACAALVSDAVKGTRDIEIVGTAINLHAGLAAIRIGAPDIVLAQDGPGIVEFTERVTKQRREAGIIIMTVDNDPVSIQRVVAALTVGAFDFITIIGKNESMHSLLLSKIRRCSIKQFSNRARRSDIENIGLNGPHTMDASPETARIKRNSIRRASHRSIDGRARGLDAFVARFSRVNAHTGYNRTAHAQGIHRPHGRGARP